MLDVIVASTDADYTTTSALKLLVMGATATSTGQDARFSAMIRAASRWADTYLGYPLSVQTYRETLPGFGRRSLLVSRTPVRAVMDVFSGTDTGTATQIQTSEFRVEDGDAGMLTMTNNAGFYWTALLQSAGTAGPFLSSIPLEPAPLSGQEYRPWLADYVAGWTYGGLSTSSANWSTASGTTSTGRTLPEDIEQAVLFRAQVLYQGAEDTQTETLGDLSVNYRSLGTDKDGRLITRYETLLDPYRRIV